MVRRKPVECMPPSEHSAFRAAERYFKSKRAPPDLSTAIDLATEPTTFTRGDGTVRRIKAKQIMIDPDFYASSSTTMQEANPSTKEAHSVKSDGQSDVAMYNPLTTMSKMAYEVEGLDGILLIPGALSPSSQRALAKEAMRSYTLPPNENNLNLHWHCYDADTKHGLWQRALAERQTTCQRTCSKIPQQRVHIEPIAGVDHVQRTAKRPSELLLRALRWVNLGHHYDWSSQLYDLKTAVPIPSDLAALSVYLCQQADHLLSPSWPRTPDDIARFEADYGRVDLPTFCPRTQKHLPRPDLYPVDHDHVRPRHSTSSEGAQKRSAFRPEAGILNLYHEGATLTGHHDRSELHPYAPLVSISLGRPGILLVGGYDREEAPLPFLLRSGDVLIMYNHGRKRIHGMPLVLPHDRSDPRPFARALKDEKDSSSGGGGGGTHIGTEDELLAEVLDDLRLNINVRQLFI